MAKGTFILVITTLFSLSVKSDDLRFLDCTGGSFTLRPERWPQWYVALGSDQNSELQGRKENLGEQRQFIFERINFYEPYCYIRSKKWKEWYVVMTNTDEGRIQSTKTRPVSEGQWKIVKTSSGEFTLSPRKWPNWYMCMKNDFVGTIIGCKDDASAGGRFLIHKV